MRKLFFCFLLLSESAFGWDSGGWKYGALAVSQSNSGRYGLGYGLTSYVADSSARQECGGYNSDCKVVLRFPKNLCIAYAVDSQNKAAGWSSHQHKAQAENNAMRVCIDSGATLPCNIVISQCN